MDSECKKIEQEKIQFLGRSSEHRGHDPGQRSGDEARFSKGKGGTCY